MSHESASTQPESFKSVPVDSELLSLFTDLLVPAAIRQPTINMDRINLALGTPAMGVSVELISQPALPGSSETSNDARQDTLKIMVNGLRGAVPLYGTRLNMEQISAEKDFKDVMKGMQERYPDETKWARQALTIRQSPGASFIEALAQLRREVPGASDTLTHKVSGKRTWSQVFNDGTNVVGTLSKGWLEPSLFKLEDGSAVEATIRTPTAMFSVHYHSSEIQGINKIVLGENNGLAHSENGLSSTARAVALIGNIAAILDSGLQSGVKSTETSSLV